MIHFNSCKSCSNTENYSLNHLSWHWPVMEYTLLKYYFFKPIKHFINILHIIIYYHVKYFLNLHTCIYTFCFSERVILYKGRTMLLICKKQGFQSVLSIPLSFLLSKFQEESVRVWHYPETGAKREALTVLQLAPSSSQLDNVQLCPISASHKLWPWALEARRQMCGFTRRNINTVVVDGLPVRSGVFIFTVFIFCCLSSL